MTPVHLILCVVVGIVHGNEMRQRAATLLANSDALYDLYVDDKATRKNGGTSHLRDFIVELLEDAEQTHQKNSPRHILTILTDDQGYADIGYNDPTFITPAMDTVATRGVKLSSFYVLNTCSPTRASLLTGRYLGQTGLQSVIFPGAKLNMRTDIPTIGTIFQRGNYSTYFIGKWHVGHTYMNMTPNARGYDYFFGVLGAAIDHFSKEGGVGCATKESKGNIFFGENCSTLNAYDLHENGQPYLDQETFAGDLFAAKAVAAISRHNPAKPLLMHLHHNAPHTPLQPPVRMFSLCDGVSDADERVLQPNFRQKICGLVTAVDFNILQVLLALATKGMLSSTLIVFHSDNGGFIEAGSLNLPFSHQKSTYHEGGVRVPAFMYSAGHKSLSAFSVTSGQHPRNVDCIFDVSDVLPTLMGYAGLNMSDLVLDGFNHWDDLISNTPLQRTYAPLYSSNGAVVHYSGGYIEVIDGIRWKYALNPRAGEFIMIMKHLNYTLEGEVLYNLDQDPAERVNLLEVVSLIPNERQQHLRVLNKLREKSIEVRSTSLRNRLPATFPPPLRFFPSQLGCWLPIDSPIYNTFKCLEKEPFVPQAWRNALDE